MDLLLDLIGNLGLSVLPAMLVFVVASRARQGHAIFGNPYLLGITFGLIAVVLIHSPVLIPLGATFDTRAGPTVLAGFFGGPIAALICSSIGGLARYNVGGPAVIGGVASLFIYGLVGLLFRRIYRAHDVSNLGAQHFLLIGAATVFFVLPSFFINQSIETGVAILQRAWPLLLIGNVSGTLLIGICFVELMRIAGEHDRQEDIATKLSLATATAQIGVWRLDYATGTVEWDDQMLSIYGLTREAFRGTAANWLSRIHPDDRVRVESNFVAARAGLSIYKDELRVVRPDGQIRTIRAEARFVPGPDGRTRFVIGVNRDISDELVNQERLQLAQQVLEAAPVGIVIARADDDMPMIYANPAFGRITGYEQEDIIGNNCRFLHRGYRDQPGLTAVREALATGASVETLLANYRKDGTLWWNRFNLAPLRRADGTVSHFIGIQQNVTEEVVLQEKLEEAQTRLTEAIDSIDNAFLLFDRNEILVHFNAALFRILPALAGGVRIGMSLHELAKIASERLRWTGENGGKLAAEELYNQWSLSSSAGNLREIRMADGQWLLASETRSASGDIVLLRADISSLKQKDEELRRQADLLEQAGQIAHIGAWQMELPSREFRWSSEIYRMHDVDPAVRPTVEMTLGFYPEGARAELRRQIEDAVTSSKPIRFELPLLTQAGRRLFVRGAGRAESEGGEVRRLIGVLQDITEEKAAQDLANATSERLRLAADAAGIGIWDWRPESGILSWDARCGELFAVGHAGQINGLSDFYKLVRPRHRTALRKAIGDLIQVGRRLDMDVETHAIGGRRKWIRLTGTQLREQYEEGPRFVGTCIEITEQRRNELVRERMQRIDIIGQLAGGIAHDFNNLLSIIQGSLFLLRPKAASAGPDSEVWRAALRATERGADLIRRIRAVTRERQKSNEPLELDRIIGETTPLLKRALTPGIALTFDLKAGSAHVRIDAGAFEDALLNLTVNAVDALPKGGRISIATSIEHLSDDGRTGPGEIPPGDYVRVSVSDTGKGMTPEVLARATEPFFSTKGERKGSGLGLSGVQAMVDGAGGFLSIRSERNVGTTIEMYLPLTRPAPDAAGVLAARGTARFDGRTVVLVDDEPDVLRVSDAMLKSLGFTTKSFADPAAALAYITAGAPADVLLTDVVMPGELSGDGLAKAARTHRPGLPILLMSGFAPDPSDRENGSSHLPMIEKPFSIEDLSSALQGAMGDGGAD